MYSCTIRFMNYVSENVYEKMGLFLVAMELIYVTAFRWLNELDKRSLLSKNLDMVCNVRMALRLDPETGMITIRGYGQDSRVISLRLASSQIGSHEVLKLHEFSFMY